MSGTVVSMARSMLMGAISVAASAAAAEMSLLIGVRKDIWFIKEELETMHAFLLSIEATKNKSMILQVWAKQVRDLAYGIEDCLEEFMVHVGNQSRCQKLLKLKDRHRIGSQIRDLKARVGEVSHRNTRYNLSTTDAFNNTDVVNSYMEDIRSHSANNIDEAELVGFLKPKEELINMVDVNCRDGLLKVICVVGMGGLGKTTLVRKAYESKENTVNKFSCCAWVIVSQSFSNIEMLKNMIMQLLGPESLRRCLKELEGKAVQVDDLGGYLREELKEKRYFVVLDDLWTIDAIKWIQHIAFPSTNTKGSRIIVTTRDVGLAKQCTSESLIYHLKHLEIDDATNLLLRKSRKTRLDMENYEEMYTVITKIVKKCGGLPLAILTIGGMLATKKLTEWGSIYKQIPSELERNPSLEAMRRIVTLSYDHLPSHLKSCFLYLSIFPEDFEIKRRRIIERWIAEGFVEGKDGVDIEDIGICYFNELINRSMIQPARVNMEGIIKSCRVHDIMRDVMVSISRDESFVYVAQDNVPSVAHKIFRHVTYHGNSKCQNISMYWSHVRSLTMFGERPFEPSHSVCSPDFRMLRTLDLENAKFEITQRDIKSIGLLRHLRYMKFGFSCGYKLPRSIGKLRYLQALDISDTYIISLPTEISKLQSLRILRCTRQPWLVFDPVEPIFCSCGDYIIFTPLANHVERVLFIAGLHMLFSSCFPGSTGVRVPKGIGNLRELRILEVVDIKRTCREAIKELGKLTQLKKLRVVADGATVKKCKILSAAIEKLSSLSSLSVDAGYHKQLKWLDYISTPPPLLRTLKLCGSLGEVPGWLRKLENLVKIYFERSYIKEGSNSMEILGAVPNLMLLHLGLRSYDGKKLVFTAGAFPKLRKLSLIGENYQLGLEEVRFHNGTSPHMEKMEFSGCNLESGITGVLNLPKLTEISLDDGGQVANLGMLQGEVDAHPNHPVLLLEVDWSYHDLGEVVQGSNTTSAVEATVREESSLHPDPAAAAAGESSSSQVVPVPMRSDSQDSEDNFCSCNSDDDDDDDDDD